MQFANSIPQGSVDKARLFFALWPSNSVSASLFKLAEEMQHRYGGRIMRRESLHLTLLFLGEVQRARIPDLVSCADKISGVPFYLSLEEFSCWRHNHIGYVAPTCLPAELGSLATMLRRFIAAAGFDFDERAYSPHVTLLRNVASPVERLSIPALRWRVMKFVLVESVLCSAGVRYVERKSWPLDGCSS